MLAGTAAVTIGFALKDLAASILAGVTIIIDRPFEVGDRVRLAPCYGEVTSIGLRSVHISGGPPPPQSHDRARAIAA